MLDEQSCVPCKGGIPPLDAEKAQKYLPEVPKWALTDENSKIRRNYAFDNFIDAQAFVNKVGDLCEAEGHHADITFGWGYCSIVFYSHKIGGLHENDFIMASKCDKIYTD